MKSSSLIACLLLTSVACGQDAARTIIERAVKAHGGADQIAKLRKAKVTYNLVGKAPRMEHLGRLNVEMEETYDLPKRIRKEVDCVIGGKPVHVVWAMSGKDYWYQENQGKVQYQKSEEGAEQQIRPYLLIEQLVVCVGNDVELNWFNRIKATIANKPMILNGVGVSSAKLGFSADLYFDDETGLLAQSRLIMPDGQEQVGHFWECKKYGELMLFIKQASWRKDEKIGEMTLRRIAYLDKVEDDVFESPDVIAVRDPQVARPMPQPDGGNWQDTWYFLAALGMLAVVVIVACMLNRNTTRNSPE